MSISSEFSLYCQPEPEYSVVMRKWEREWLIEIWREVRIYTQAKWRRFRYVVTRKPRIIFQPCWSSRRWKSLT